jgi:spore coat polysaccharide biosynthesis protein SpsF (cytidylyltransferase family)
MKPKTDNIEFQDFSKSVTTAEFLGIYNIVESMNDKFIKTLDSNKKAVYESEAKLKSLLESNGRFGIKYLEEKAFHKGLKIMLINDVKKDYAVFLQNYDGIIEFLKRFNPLSSDVKKINIKIFKTKKDGQEKNKT